MLSDSIRILNFDDSITKQQKLLSAYKNEILDLKDIAPEARFWFSGATKDKIRKSLASSNKNALTFIGSGDFHHITNILISSFEDPITVFSFDFHPDLHFLNILVSCGSWVGKTLENKNVLKFILAGISSRDISSFYIQTTDLKSLKDDRLEIYPYSHPPSVVFLNKVPENISIDVKAKALFTTIYWNELKNKNLVEFFLHIIRRLPTKNVYISIDKDCLRRENARTNWEEGRLSLEDLLLILKLIKENTDIVGADVTGDYSDINVKGITKKIISHFDHPKDYSAKDSPESHITGINEETNIEIARLLLS